MQNNKLQILYEDDHLVAVNKPARMLVHRSKIDKLETEFVVQRLRDQIEQKVFSLHRLDKPTSGVLLFAKSSAIASLFQPMFVSHSIEKKYLAVIRGYVTEPTTIDYPLIEQLDKTTDNLDKHNPPREAITHVTPIVSVEINKPVSRYQTARFSIVRLCPQTGRKHQLRRHMAHFRHPIIGDTTHGDGKQNKFARAELASYRLLLHAYKMAFIHPVTSDKVEIIAPLDDAFLQSISNLCEDAEHREQLLDKVVTAISY